MNTNNPEIKKGSELAARSPAGSLMSFDELDNFFDDFMLRKWPRLLDWSFPIGTGGMPRVDILEHDTEIEVQAALPGINKEDLDVSINHQTITISVSVKEEKAEEGKYFRREIMRGGFQRTFSLPAEIDSDNAKASFKDGILKVMIPKSETSKSKTIQIQ